eukprot:ANDGO_00342.mRNA.1 hypothetical protein
MESLLSISLNNEDVSTLNNVSLVDLDKMSNLDVDLDLDNDDILKDATEMFKTSVSTRVKFRQCVAKIHDKVKDSGMDTKSAFRTLKLVLSVQRCARRFLAIREKNRRLVSKYIEEEEKEEADRRRKLEEGLVFLDKIQRQASEADFRVLNRHKSAISRNSGAVILRYWKRYRSRYLYNKKRKIAAQKIFMFWKRTFNRRRLKRVIEDAILQRRSRHATQDANRGDTRESKVRLLQKIVRGYLARRKFLHALTLRALEEEELEDEKRRIALEEGLKFLDAQKKQQSDRDMKFLRRHDSARRLHAAGLIAKYWQSHQAQVLQNRRRNGAACKIWQWWRRSICRESLRAFVENAVQKRRSARALSDQMTRDILSASALLAEENSEVDVVVHAEANERSIRLQRSCAGVEDTDEEDLHAIRSGSTSCERDQEGHYPEAKDPERELELPGQRDMSDDAAISDPAEPQTSSRCEEEDDEDEDEADNCRGDMATTDQDEVIGNESEMEERVQSESDESPIADEKFADEDGTLEDRQDEYHSLKDGDHENLDAEMYVSRTGDDNSELDVRRQDDVDAEADSESSRDSGMLVDDESERVDDPSTGCSARADERTASGRHEASVNDDDSMHSVSHEDVDDFESKELTCGTATAEIGSPELVRIPNVSSVQDGIGSYRYAKSSATGMSTVDDPDRERFSSYLSSIRREREEREATFFSTKVENVKEKSRGKIAPGPLKRQPNCKPTDEDILDERREFEALRSAIQRSTASSSQTPDVSASVLDRVHIRMEEAKRKERSLLRNIFSGASHDYRDIDHERSKRKHVHPSALRDRHSMRQPPDSSDNSAIASDTASSTEQTRALRGRNFPSSPPVATSKAADSLSSKPVSAARTRDLQPKTAVRSPSVMMARKDADHKTQSPPSEDPLDVLMHMQEKQSYQQSLTLTIAHIDVASTRKSNVRDEGSKENGEENGEENNEENGEEGADEESYESNSNNSDFQSRSCRMSAKDEETPMWLPISEEDAKSLRLMDDLLEEVDASSAVKECCPLEIPSVLRDAILDRIEYATKPRPAGSKRPSKPATAALAGKKPSTADAVPPPASIDVSRMIPCMVDAAVVLAERLLDDRESLENALNEETDRVTFEILACQAVPVARVGYEYRPFFSKSGDEIWFSDDFRLLSMKGCTITPPVCAPLSGICGVCLVSDRIGVFLRCDGLLVAFDTCARAWMKTVWVDVADCHELLACNRVSFSKSQNVLVAQSSSVIAVVEAISLTLIRVIQLDFCFSVFFPIGEELLLILQPDGKMMSMTMHCSSDEYEVVAVYHTNCLSIISSGDWYLSVLDSDEFVLRDATLEEVWRCRMYHKSPIAGFGVRDDFLIIFFSDGVYHMFCMHDITVQLGIDDAPSCVLTAVPGLYSKPTVFRSRYGFPRVVFQYGIVSSGVLKFSFSTAEDKFLLESVVNGLSAVTELQVCRCVESVPKRNIDQFERSRDVDSRVALGIAASACEDAAAQDDGVDEATSTLLSSIQKSARALVFTPMSNSELMSMVVDLQQCYDHALPGSIGCLCDTGLDCGPIDSYASEEPKRQCWTAIRDIVESSDSFSQLLESEQNPILQECCVSDMHRRLNDCRQRLLSLRARSRNRKSEAFYTEYSASPRADSPRGSSDGVAPWSSISGNGTNRIPLSCFLLERGTFLRDQSIRLLFRNVCAWFVEHPPASRFQLDPALLIVNVPEGTVFYKDYDSTTTQAPTPTCFTPPEYFDVDSVHGQTPSVVFSLGMLLFAMYSGLASTQSYSDELASYRRDRPRTVHSASCPARDFEFQLDDSLLPIPARSLVRDCVRISSHSRLTLGSILSQEYCNVSHDGASGGVQVESDGFATTAVDWCLSACSSDLAACMHLECLDRSRRALIRHVFGADDSTLQKRLFREIWTSGRLKGLFDAAAADPESLTDVLNWVEAFHFHADDAVFSQFFEFLSQILLGDLSVVSRERRNCRDVAAFWLKKAVSSWLNDTCPDARSFSALHQLHAIVCSLTGIPAESVDSKTARVRIKNALLSICNSVRQYSAETCGLLAGWSVFSGVLTKFYFGEEAVEVRDCFVSLWRSCVLCMDSESVDRLSKYRSLYHPHVSNFVCRLCASASQTSNVAPIFATYVRLCPRPLFVTDMWWKGKPLAFLHAVSLHPISVSYWLSRRDVRQEDADFIRKHANIDLNSAVFGSDCSFEHLVTMSPSLRFLCYKMLSDQSLASPSQRAALFSILNTVLKSQWDYSLAALMVYIVAYLGMSPASTYERNLLRECAAGIVEKIKSAANSNDLECRMTALLRHVTGE